MLLKALDIAMQLGLLALVATLGQLCLLALVATLGQLCLLALVATQTSRLPVFSALALVCAVLEVRLKPWAVLMMAIDHCTLLRGPGAHALRDLHEFLQGIQSQGEQNNVD